MRAVGYKKSLPIENPESLLDLEIDPVAAIAFVLAWALYASDYIRRCVDVLVETGADNVGGTMLPVGTTRFGRAVAAVTTSPIGVGPGPDQVIWTGASRDTVIGRFQEPAPAAAAEAVAKS